jgi:hypothetical protein
MTGTGTRDQGFQQPQMLVRIVEAWVSKGVKLENSNRFKPSEDLNRGDIDRVAHSRSLAHRNAPDP